MTERAKKIARGEEEEYFDVTICVTVAAGTVLAAWDTVSVEKHLPFIGCRDGNWVTTFEVASEKWIGSFSSTRTAYLTYRDSNLTFVANSENDVAFAVLSDPERVTSNFASAMEELRVVSAGTSAEDYLYRVTQPTVFLKIVFLGAVTPSTNLRFFLVMHGHVVKVDQEWYLRERISHRNYSAGVGIGGVKYLP
jgi:hypothetical protein